MRARNFTDIPINYNECFWSRYNTYVSSSETDNGYSDVYDTGGLRL